MADKLQRLFEYRALRAEPPSAHDEQALARIEQLQRQLPQGVPALDERDPYTLLTEPLPVEFAHAGRFRMDVVLNVGTDDLTVVTSDPPMLGQRISLHVHDRAHGAAYVFVGSVVARVVSGETHGMSVALEGPPRQTRLAKHSSGVWNASEPQDDNGQSSSRKQRSGR